MFNLLKPKIIVDEMTITDPYQFTKFKNEKIAVSTHDSVKVQIKNPKIETILKLAKVLNVSLDDFVTK